MRRIHYAILIGQLLSYALIVTFVFADATFGFVENLVGEEPTFYSNTHFVSACLIGLVGAASIWVSFFYIRKSEAMRDWIVLCAWTQRVKSGNRWISITEFLSDYLGYNVTHGMSEEVVDELRSEIDTNWKKITPATDDQAAAEEAEAGSTEPIDETGESPARERMPTTGPSRRLRIRPGGKRPAAAPGAGGENKPLN